MSAAQGGGAADEEMRSGGGISPERRLKLRSRERRVGDASAAAGTAPEKLLAARSSRWRRGGRGREAGSAPEREAPRRSIAATAAADGWHVTPRQRQWLEAEAEADQAASAAPGSWVTAALSARSAARSADEAAAAASGIRRRRKRRGTCEAAMAAAAEVGVPGERAGEARESEWSGGREDDEGKRGVACRGF